VTIPSGTKLGRYGAIPLPSSTHRRQAIRECVINLGSRAPVSYSQIRGVVGAGGNEVNVFG